MGQGHVIILGSLQTCQAGFAHFIVLTGITGLQQPARVHQQQGHMASYVEILRLT